jgi:hypothetical protein
MIIMRNAEYSYLHAGDAVPRYQKVATPTRRSTFCDRHMQTLTAQLPAYYSGQRPPLRFHESMDPFIHKDSFIQSPSDGSFRSRKRVSYSFQQSAWMYVDRAPLPTISHSMMILRLLPRRSSHSRTAPHIPIDFDVDLPPSWITAA